MLKNFIILLLVVYSSISLAVQLPDESVYQYDSTWTDQNKKTINLSELRGQARLVAFVYTYCEHTCPLIVSNIKETLKALPENMGKHLPVTLVTLDPTRDTPDQMRGYMEKNSLDQSQWTMLSGNAIDVRVLSNIFGVKYRPMNQDELAHSNMITLLDSKGVIQSQLMGLNEDKSEIVRQIVSLQKME